MLRLRYPHPLLPRASLLTLEEIVQVGRCFVDLGVHKIRITGGEPLHRRNIIKVFRELGEMEGLRDLTVTTNGTQLPRFARPLRDAGVTRVNISLDTLRADRFRNLTRNGKIEKVLAGLDAAQAAGFSRIKLNAVILKNRNHDEIGDLLPGQIQTVARFLSVCVDAGGIAKRPFEIGEHLFEHFTLD